MENNSKIQPPTADSTTSNDNNPSISDNVVKKVVPVSIVNTPSTNVQTLVGNVINTTPTRNVSDSDLPLVIIAPEDPQGSVPLTTRPSYFVPGQAQPKTLDDEGIKMMKSGNKILLPKLEGTQGFVVPGPSQVLTPTNKIAGTRGENLTPKPDYSYASMICQAIFASLEKKSTLAEIYEWISTTYPFFKKSQQGWKNSIRHNLSLNAAFVRASRGEGATGKGGYWTVDPIYERYFVNGHFKPPSSETRGSYKRTKSDENEIIITNTAAATNKKNGRTQSPKQIVRERLRQVREAAAQFALQLKGEKEVKSSKKRTKVETMKSVEKVPDTVSRDGVSTNPENDIEKIIRKIAEGCDDVYRRYYDGNEPNWQGDAEFFASFNPFLNLLED